MTAYCDARREMAALLTYARMERRSSPTINEGVPR